MTEEESETGLPGESHDRLQNGGATNEGSPDREARRDSEQSSLIGYAIAGKYVCERLIAKSSMSRVYQARQAPLGRRVAVKVLLADALKDGDEGNLRARIRREAETLAQISHPNVVTIIDYDVEPNGMVYLVMEFVDGITLSAAVRERGPIHGARLIRIALQTAAALEEIHGCGVVHRDLKPSNIMLQRRAEGDELVKVVDFGIVKRIAGDDDLEDTNTKLRVGSPRYMAPEQIVGTALGPATDVYALGYVLYFLASGRSPFTQTDSVQLMYAQISTDAVPLNELELTHPVSEDLSIIVQQCMHKKPEDRYASMRDVISALMTTPEYQGMTRNTSPTLSQILTHLPRGDAAGAALAAAISSPPPSSAPAPEFAPPAAMSSTTMDAATMNAATMDAAADDSNPWSSSFPHANDAIPITLDHPKSPNLKLAATIATVGLAVLLSLIWWAGRSDEDVPQPARADDEAAKETAPEPSPSTTSPVPAATSKRDESARSTTESEAAPEPLDQPPKPSITAKRNRRRAAPGRVRARKRRVAQTASPNRAKPNASATSSGSANSPNSSEPSSGASSTGSAAEPSASPAEASPATRKTPRAPIPSDFLDPFQR